MKTISFDDVFVTADGYGVSNVELGSLSDVVFMPPSSEDRLVRLLQVTGLNLLPPLDWGQGLEVRPPERGSYGSLHVQEIINGVVRQFNAVLDYVGVTMRPSGGGSCRAS